MIGTNLGLVIRAVIKYKNQDQEYPEEEFRTTYQEKKKKKVHVRTYQLLSSSRKENGKTTFDFCGLGAAPHQLLFPL